MLLRCSVAPLPLMSCFQILCTHCCFSTDNPRYASEGFRSLSSLSSTPSLKLCLDVYCINSEGNITTDMAHSLHCPPFLVEVSLDKNAHGRGCNPSSVIYQTGNTGCFAQPVLLNINSFPNISTCLPQTYQ